MFLMHPCHATYMPFFCWVLSFRTPRFLLVRPCVSVTFYCIHDTCYLCGVCVVLLVLGDAQEWGCVFNASISMLFTCLLFVGFCPPCTWRDTPHGWAAPRAAAQRGRHVALPMDTCGDTHPPGTHGPVAATMPSPAHAGAAQEAPDIGQWEGQDVPLVRPSSCIVKGGIPSSRRYPPTYLLALGDAQE